MDDFIPNWMRKLRVNQLCNTEVVRNLGNLACEISLQTIGGTSTSRCRRRPECFLLVPPNTERPNTGVYTIGEPGSNANCSIRPCFLCGLSTTGSNLGLPTIALSFKGDLVAAAGEIDARLRVSTHSSVDLEKTLCLCRPAFHRRERVFPSPYQSLPIQMERDGASRLIGRANSRRYIFAPIFPKLCHSSTRPSPPSSSSRGSLLRFPHAV